LDFTDKIAVITGSGRGIDRLIDEAEKAFGGLDILICNAASGYNRPVTERKVKGWNWTMADTPCWCR
jgi:NAD(P)-dependent dehydrogenase (short-subunit alcohol dehydrogenase family)